MGYNYINFPSPFLFPIRGGTGGNEPEKDENSDIKAGWILVFFVVVGVLTMILADEIRKHLIQKYNEREKYERVHQKDTH